MHQARPRLESTTRFQNLIVKKDTRCFQLEPLVCLSLRRYSVELDTIMPPQADYGREARFFCKLRIKLESYHICWSVELPEWSPDQMLRKPANLRKPGPPTVRSLKKGTGTGAELRYLSYARVI